MSSDYKESFHNIKTRRLDFIKLNIDDYLKVHEYVSNEDVSRFIGWNLMKNEEETKHFIEELIKREELDTHWYSSIVEAKSGKIIGNVMLFNFDRAALNVEIGYVLHQDFWNKGYGNEIVDVLSSFIFDEMKFKKIYAKVIKNNIPSSIILQKNGFLLEGDLKDHLVVEGEYMDLMILSKFAEEKNV
jgi:ribosomal-protein-alanine N-acetyltransferase